MGQILGYEIKKILRRPLTKVVLIAAAFILFMSVAAPAWDSYHSFWGPEYYGSYEEIPPELLKDAHEKYKLVDIYDGVVYATGRQAIEMRKEAEEYFNGTWDDERLARIVSDYQEFRGNPDNFTDTLDTAQMQYTTWSFIAQGMSEAEAEAYGKENPIYIMKPEVQYSAEGRKWVFMEYLLFNHVINPDGSARSFKEAFPLAGDSAEYEYHDGMRKAVDNQSMVIGSVALFLLLALLAPVFSEEVSCRTEPMLLASKYGRDKLIRSKVMAAMLTAMGALLIMTLANFLLHGFFYGFGGLNTPVQLNYYNADIPYTVNHWQYLLMFMGIQALGLCAFSGLVLLASSLLRSAIPVVFAGAVLTFINIMGANTLNEKLRHVCQTLPGGISMPHSLVAEGTMKGWGKLPISQLSLALTLCAVLLVASTVIILKKYKRLSKA